MGSQCVCGSVSAAVGLAAIIFEYCSSQSHSGRDGVKGKETRLNEKVRDIGMV